MGATQIPLVLLKSEFKSFPTVYDNPILLQIYTVGKLLSPTFACSEVLRGTQTCHGVLAPGVPESSALLSWRPSLSIVRTYKTVCNKGYFKPVGLNPGLIAE